MFLDIIFSIKYNAHNLRTLSGIHERDAITIQYSQRQPHRQPHRTTSTHTHYLVCHEFSLQRTIVLTELTLFFYIEIYSRHDNLYIDSLLLSPTTLYTLLLTKLYTDSLLLWIHAVEWVFSPLIHFSSLGDLGACLLSGHVAESEFFFIKKQIINKYYDFLIWFF